MYMDSASFSLKVHFISKPSNYTGLTFKSLYVVIKNNDVPVLGCVLDWHLIYHVDFMWSPVIILSLTHGPLL